MVPPSFSLAVTHKALSNLNKLWSLTEPPVTYYSLIDLACTLKNVFPSVLCILTPRTLCRSPRFLSLIAFLFSLLYQNSEYLQVKKQKQLLLFFNNEWFLLFSRMTEQSVLLHLAQLFRAQMRFLQKLLRNRNLSQRLKGHV